MKRDTPCFCFVLNLLAHGSQPHSTEEYRSFFPKKQTSPKPVFVRQDFGEAVKKEEK